MNNLYNKKDVEDIIYRLEKLTKDSKREWGTMSISQMLVHLNVSLEPALGLTFPKRKLVGRFLSPILKRIYLNKQPMIKNSRTNDSYVVTGEYDFEEVRKKAIEMVKLFYQNGEIMAKGKYVNQKKEGLWISYGTESIKVEEGNYEEDKKEGL